MACSGRTTVTIAICTYKRPLELRRVLEAMVQQSVPVPWVVKILVIDNDARGSGRDALTAELQAGRELDIRIVIERSIGVGNARQRALDEVAEEPGPLIFFDDDQIPEAGWLTCLLEKHIADPQVMWSAPVQPVLPENLPRWAGDGWPWSRPRYPDGSSLAVAGNGNLLLPSEVRRLPQCVYSDHFRSGMGEDTELTQRLVRAGVKIRYASGAKAFEVLSSERISKHWVLDRNRSASAVWAKLQVLDGSRALLVGSVMKQAATAFLVILGFLTHNEELRFRGQVAVSILEGYREGLGSQ